jgi:hypothetical protein
MDYLNRITGMIYNKCQRTSYIDILNIFYLKILLFIILFIRICKNQFVCMEILIVNSF